MIITDTRPIELIHWSWGLKPKEKYEWWMNYLKSEPRSLAWKRAYAQKASQTPLQRAKKLDQHQDLRQPRYSY